MKRIRNILNHLGTDGLAHIIVCAAIVLVLQVFSPWWVAVAVSASAGLLKEFVWDLWMKRGCFDVKDLLCDLTGVVLGCLAFL